jgi:hypothetical protein
MGFDLGFVFSAEIDGAPASGSPYDRGRHFLDSPNRFAVA